MTVFAISRFTGIYPTGTAAVIVAETKEQAIEQIREWQKEQGLKQDEANEIQVDIVDPNQESYLMLCDGDY